MPTTPYPERIPNFVIPLRGVPSILPGDAQQKLERLQVLPDKVIGVQDAQSSKRLFDKVDQYGGH